MNTRGETRAAFAAERIWTVIVNWRQSADTLACLASLIGAGADRRRIVLVDNEANGDLERRVHATYPDVTVLEQRENLGFAKAVNIGTRYALAHGASATLLLNNDAVVLPGAMHAMADRLADAPDLGVVTAKVFLSRAPDRLWAVGGVFTGRQVVELGAREPDAGAYDDAPLDFVYGCAMLMRADMFRQVGGFDERYFLYYEDIDFCLRAREAGWRVGMAPNACVLHEGSKSTRAQPSMKVYHHARSRALFFSRHLRGARAAFAVSELAFVARRVGADLITGKWRNVASYIRGTLDGLRSRTAGLSRGGTPVAARGRGG